MSETKIPTTDREARRLAQLRREADATQARKDRDQRIREARANTVALTGDRDF